MRLVTQTSFPTVEITYPNNETLKHALSHLIGTVLVKFHTLEITSEIHHRQLDSLQKKLRDLLRISVTLLYEITLSLSPVTCFYSFSLFSGYELAIKTHESNLLLLNSSFCINPSNFRFHCFETDSICTGTSSTYTPYSHLFF